MLQLDGVSFAYGEQVVLSGVSLVIAPGERVVLVGANGSGKSTFARLLVGELVPSAGEIAVDGRSPAGMPRAELAALVGYVGQDPLAQIVSSTVKDEVAFGPQNLGLPAGDVEQRVDDALERCALTSLSERDIHALSGGEQQRLALAGVLAMGCRYLVLDEVTSHLDAASQAQLRAVVDELVAVGVGVLEISHRTSDLAGANRVLTIERGHIRLLETGNGSDSGDISLSQSFRCIEMPVGGTDSLDMPSIDQQNRRSDECLFSSNRGKLPPTGISMQGDKYAPDRHEGIGSYSGLSSYPSNDGAAPGKGLELRRVVAGYEGAPILDGCTLSFPVGEVSLVVGPSGAGKTTLAQVAAGVLAPLSGRVLLNGTPVRQGMVGLSFQRPEDQLFCNTVFDELAYAPRNAGIAEIDVDARAHRALAAVGLPEDMLATSPFELSGGERRRVALAAVIAGEPDAYVFDEPTAGLDAAGVQAVRQIVSGLAAAGASVVVVTHEPEQWSDVAGQVVSLDVRDAGEGTDAARSTHRTTGRILGAYRTKHTWLHSVDALHKLLALCALTVGIFAAGPWGVLGGAVLLLGLMVSAGLGWCELVAGVKPTAIVLALSLLANAIVVNGSYDLQLVGMVGFSYAGLVRGALAVARIVETVGFVLLVSSTTRPPELARSISRLLAPLVHLGVPVADLSITLMLVLRLIPETITAFRRIETAQRARGATFDEGGPVQRLRSRTAVLIPLIVELFARSDDLARAMRARAYDSSRVS